MKSHCFENNLQNEKVSYCNKYFMLSYLNILAWFSWNTRKNISAQASCTTVLWAGKAKVTVYAPSGPERIEGMPEKFPCVTTTFLA